MWRCVLTKDRTIEVYSSDNLKGKYQLLEEPYCKYCSSPNTTTEECTLHQRCYGFTRAFAIGSYFPSRGNPDSKGWNDLLSNHIRGVKLYPGYSVPLGLGLTLCIKHVYSSLQNMDLIVPVPKFSSELRVSQDNGRSFNQAIEIANVINGQIKMPVAEALLKLKAQKMKGLSEDERWKAVKGIYQIKDDVDIAGKKVLLIDDVFTSGATLSECSSVLLKNGAQNVNVLVAGRDTFDNGA